jgi:hypothetical protein
MARFLVKGMGGMIPRLDAGELPDNMAAEAIDCDLRSGTLDGLPSAPLVIDLTDQVGDGRWTRRAYRFPNADNTDVAWLALPSEHSSVVRSPLTNDSQRRLYWTNPGDAYPWWLPWQYLKDGNPNFPVELGIVQPDPAIVLAATATGGTVDGSIPLVARSYVYTFINDYGEESAPSVPSATVEGPPDATWTVLGMPPGPGVTPPGVPPSNPVGRKWVPVTQLRLYRTVTGLQTGASFYEVATFRYGVNDPPGVYVDTTTDLEIIDHQLLQSTNWGNPPVGLDGLVALPGGMLVGFTNNTLHFCEPYRPHTWPAIYDQSVLYDIVALAVWQQSLVVLTAGFPSTGQGNSPVNYRLTSVQVNEPCIARGSVVVDLMGVLYASQNGLIKLNYYGMENITLESMTKNVWLERYQARRINACRHRSQYLASFFDRGFVFDSTEKRLGFIDINILAGALSVWNDEHSGDTYFVRLDQKVYLWDGETQPLVDYFWRSKHYYSPAPISLGACHISMKLPDREVASDLPEGVNARFSIFAGPELTLVMTRDLTKATEIFRLPSGFKAFDWQFAVHSHARIDHIELASTMKELQGV